jgi:hypothetical protein
MDQATNSRPNLALRRVIASVGIIVFLCGYVVGVSDLGRHLPPHNTLLTLLYYALAGTLWGVPILPLISWSEAYKKARP